jgi:hypothetical protein
MMDAAQLRALAKVQKCLNLAADVRGDPTTRETARRQAQALIRKHGLQIDHAMREAQVPAVPHLSSPEWGSYWARHRVLDAIQAGIRSPVLCRDGWFVPG